MKKISVFLTLSLLLILFQVGHASELEVYFINVGQGDSILIKTPNNKTILIDAGIHSAAEDGYNPFLYLKSHNIKKLDAVFITHPHDDHYKGFNYLCTKKGEKEFPVKTVYYSVTPGPEYGKFQSCLEDIIKRSDVNGQVSARGPPLEFGDVVFTVIYPEEPISQPSKNKNLDSIVMKMTYKNVSFIFTGDADKEVEDLLQGDLQSTILKVGHHGSRTSTSKTFLKKVDPEYAVISCNNKDGKGKTYGHPHDPALKALKTQKVKLYRTDLSGTIIIKSDGNSIVIIVENEVSQNSSELWSPGEKTQ
ncbi:MAG: hypothetical protein C0415_05970 [Thermodesulfovibrio sp.]|nr:hypothetical protein [Thermodesulfovibrio sp.]